MSALDRLGAALCDLVPLHLPNGVFLHEGRCVLVAPAVDYDCLTDAMFHLIRQNASTSAAVLIRMLEVLTAVASCERDAARLSACNDTPTSSSATLTDASQRPPTWPISAGAGHVFARCGCKVRWRSCVTLKPTPAASPAKRAPHDSPL